MASVNGKAHERSVRGAIGGMQRKLLSWWEKEVHMVEGVRDWATRIFRGQRVAGAGQGDRREEREWTDEGGGCLGGGFWVVGWKLPSWPCGSQC